METEQYDIFNPHSEKRDIKEVIQALKDLPYGRTLIAAQIQQQMGKVLKDIVEIVGCNYIAPLPGENISLDSYVLYTDTKNIDKEEIEYTLNKFIVTPMKEIYPEINCTISFMTK